MVLISVFFKMLRVVTFTFLVNAEFCLQNCVFTFTFWGFDGHLFAFIFFYKNIKAKGSRNNFKRKWPTKMQREQPKSDDVSKLKTNSPYRHS